MLLETTPDYFNPLREALMKAYRMDETEMVHELLNSINLSVDAQSRIAQQAEQFVVGIRTSRLKSGGLDAFMQEYDLSSTEGIALMCLAEALLRVPDKKTVDALIQDKIGHLDWSHHRGQSHSLFVNAATWGLMLTGKFLSGNNSENYFSNTLKKLAKGTSMPVIRRMVSYAMKILGEQFVMGRHMGEAIKRAKELEAKGYRYSYDMLGEAARTADDAKKYFESYVEAIEAIGSASKEANVFNSPGISVKLSALHPRYEFAKRKRLLSELTPRLLKLAELAKEYNVGLTVDAEEADCLDISLDIIEQVFSSPQLEGYEGFGLALQSYQKRAFYVIDWLEALSKKYKRRWMIRLIKGAYWDTEIKHTQELGLNGYPVYTRKISTDVSFIACAQKLLSMPHAFYPQFATHNAQTLATVIELAGDRRDMEFQCLHGMGEPLYDQVVGSDPLGRSCRIYAPVGKHEDLLPYLMRRLLENGANSSFVNRIIDEDKSVQDLIQNPIDQVKALNVVPHPKIPLPLNMYGNYRGNSKGIDLTNVFYLKELEKGLEKASKKEWQAKPSVGGENLNAQQREVISPSNHERIVGTVIASTKEQVEKTLECAKKGYEAWHKTSVEQRATVLEKMAELLEEHYADFMYLAIHEAGKTIPDAVSEVREAIDFCYYYASQARNVLEPEQLPGPTGESNQLHLSGRGVISCISPWNFPLAIFTGQVAAALAAGNAVIAKPAEQTPLIASLAVQLLHKAGVPKDVVFLLPGRGSVIGAQLINDLRTDGVMFTGSTETARYINQHLAGRVGPIVPFIAETGGQNAMIVDSTALPEQVIQDVLLSAFGSAGQRCSALRVLFIQDDVADKFITMLKGAMAELEVGDPSLLSTDVGPVIDQGALSMLEEHAKRMQTEARLIYQISLSHQISKGTFFSPRAFELDSIKQLPEEIFGPILHVIRYKKNDLDKIIDEINATGYGLTFGIQTRVEETAQYVQSRMNVGNVYINRNMIGAVVGVQPFGGEGLSGTGPKAGGPHYLARLSKEKTICIDTTAAGGNASLLSLED